MANTEKQNEDYKQHLHKSIDSIENSKFLEFLCNLIESFHKSSWGL